MDKRARKSNIRQQGSKPDRGRRRRVINFNLSKIVPDQGQTLQDWGKSGLLLKLTERMKQIGALTREEALHQKMIKEYPASEGFPSKSKFKKPTYLSPERWAVMHLTNTSVEVVVGYIEEDVFFVVFLDKNHEFWPASLQDRGKVKR